MKKLLFVVLAIFISLPLGYAQSNDFYSNIKQLSEKELLDAGNYYFEKNSGDTALVFYNLYINSTSKNADLEQQKLLIGTLSNAASIYFFMCDYRSAYDLLIKALRICEKTDYAPLTSIIYSNIGNIYYRFEKFDIAKLYYAKALHLCKDSANMVAMLNNLGASEVESNNLDSGYYWLNKSLTFSKQHENIHLYSTLNSMASLYEKREQYDSAFLFYRLSLIETRKKNNIEKETQNLSDLGKLFFKVNKIDSALFYIDLSSDMARTKNYPGILADNYLTLSKIEDAQGNTKNAYNHFQKYVELRDSIFNTDKFNEISQLQRLYEVSKTNEQIEQLVVEKHKQKVIWVATLTILLLVTAVLLFVYYQKRKLNNAYKTLFEKNIEIIKLQEKPSEKELEKYKKSTLSDVLQNELLNKILLLMEDSSIICDTEFSLDKLAELTQSNHAYVSQVINTALKKNFRSLLNSYRIREAQRLFANFDIAKYTIESVASQVGYKSPTTFRDAFKEITGVSPNYYLKEMQEFNSHSG